MFMIHSRHLQNKQNSAKKKKKVSYHSRGANNNTDFRMKSANEKTERVKVT